MDQTSMAVDDKVSDSFAAGDEQDAIACATPADAIAGGHGCED